MADLDRAKQLKRMLASLLGESGINVLGKYLLNGNTESPAIRLNMVENGVTRKIKPNSGIECTIEPQPDVSFTPQRFGTCLDLFYAIALDQHDSNKTLNNAIRVIYAHPILRPLNSPIVRPRIEVPNQQGGTPARCLLFIPVFEYQPNLF